MSLKPDKCTPSSARSINGLGDAYADYQSPPTSLYLTPTAGRSAHIRGRKSLSQACMCEREDFKASGRPTPRPCLLPTLRPRHTPLPTSAILRAGHLSDSAVGTVADRAGEPVCALYSTT
ncbi:unnamed protein product [Schistocephalus solidus]|uniref:Uncharacterized protein n=1 Tax=Schistocephalus solidus TaxID=70667 RepID=A0A183SI16_SCHSO|nr:unnamed protein product [Schistocephalus solidus]